MYCGSKCKMISYRLNRLRVAKEQGLSVTESTSVSTDNWCFEHEVEKSVCRLMKHKG